MKYSIILFLILALLTMCSKKTDKDYFSEATKLLSEDKISDAVMIFEKIINDFPESELVPQAIIQVAGIYHSKKITTISPRVSLEKADSLFYLVYQKFPDSEEGALGLFMSGFIQANELNNYQKATNTYNTFLKKYPDHEMAVSAKQELDYMGLSPEEILRKKLAAQE